MNMSYSMFQNHDDHTMVLPHFFKIFLLLLLLSGLALLYVCFQMLLLIGYFFDAYLASPHEGGKICYVILKKAASNSLPYCR